MAKVKLPLIAISLLAVGSGAAIAVPKGPSNQRWAQQTVARQAARAKVNYNNASQARAHLLSARQAQAAAATRNHKRAAGAAAFVPSSSRGVDSDDGYEGTFVQPRVAYSSLLPIEKPPEARSADSQPVPMESTVKPAEGHEP